MIVRRTFSIEASLSDTAKIPEQVEWLQKFMDYFHPSLAAVVKIDGTVVTAPPVQAVKIGDLIIAQPNTLLD